MQAPVEPSGTMCCIASSYKIDMVSINYEQKYSPLVINIADICREMHLRNELQVIYLLLKRFKLIIFGR